MRRLRRAPLLAALAFAGLALSATSAHAGEPSPFRGRRVRLDSGLIFTRFEQQVKAEVGGARGERLVEETGFGWSNMLTYRLWGPIALGGFVQLDAGKRSAGRFTGTTLDGRTLVVDEVGGKYTELWMGPMIRAEYMRLFIEAGYGLFGRRMDSARSDLPSASGSTEGALGLLPGSAWTFSLGGHVPIAAFARTELDLVARLQYRIRYYDTRSGEAFAGDLVHGTQSFTPFVGVAWTFGSFTGPFDD